MKLRCPACGVEGELDFFTQAAELLALDRAAAAFGEDWPLVKEYLDCFQGKRALKVDRRLGLAREIWKIYDAGQFEFNRSWYLIGRPEFREALRATCNQVTPPLTNHHYLLRVLMAAARQTSQRREREFKAGEETLRCHGRDGPSEEEVTGIRARLDDPKWRQRASELSRAVRLAKLPAAKAEAEAALKAHFETKPCSNE